MKKPLIVTLLGITTLIGATSAWLETTQPSYWVEAKLEARLAMIPNYQDVNELPPFEPETEDQVHYGRMSDRACGVENIYKNLSSTTDNERDAILTYCKTAEPIDVTLVCSHDLPGVCLGMEEELKYNPLYNVTDRLILDYDGFGHTKDILSTFRELFLEENNYVVMEYSKNRERSVWPTFLKANEAFAGKYSGRGPDVLPYTIGFPNRCIALHGCEVVDEKRYIPTDEWIKNHATREFLADSTHDVLEDIIQKIGREQ